MRSFPELFSAEALVSFWLSALENFVTFSVKLDWLRPFLLMSCVGAAACIFISERAAFAENLKSSRSDLFFKIAVLKQFTNFPKTIRGGVFLLGKTKKLYTPTDVFLRIFSDFSEQPFFRVTASVERKKFQKQLSGYVF